MKALKAFKGLFILIQLSKMHGTGGGGGVGGGLN